MTSSQNVVAQYRYDPYGNLLNGAVGQDQVYTYNAQQYTPQTGLQYLRARYYDASTGNFTSKDTYLGSQKSLVTQNRYTYGNNNPVSYQDPSGHAGLFSKIVSAAKSVVSTVVKTVTSVAKSVTKAVVNTVQKVVAAVQTAVKTVTTAVQSAAKTVASTAKAVVSAAKTKVTAAATAVKSAVSTASQMVSQVKSTLSSAAGAINSGAAYVADATQSAYTTVTAAISPAISRYNSSKVAVPLTQLDYTTIEDDIVPLTNAIQGETSVAEMHQNAGAAWFGDSSNGNIWDQKITQWFGQKFQKIFPAFKDSSIELTAGLLWGYIKQDTLKQADADSKEDSLGTKVLDGFQLALDIVGFIPAYGEIADGINAGIYAMRGDYLNAGLSLAACVPVLGIGATGGKVINKGIKLIDKADDIYDAAKSAEKIIEGGLNASEELTTLYRAVGPKEFYDVMETGKFSVIPQGLQAKQFGLNLEQTIEFAEKYPDLAAVIEVKVPKSVVDKLGDLTQVDSFIFKDGTLTIHVDDLEDFNKAIQSLSHIY